MGRAFGLVLVLVALAGLVGCGSQTGATRSPRSRSEVAGVRFVPAGRAVSRECQTTADAVGYPVPCPTLLPARIRQFPEVHGCQLRIVGVSSGRTCGGALWRGWLVGDGGVFVPGSESLLQHLALQGAPKIVGNPARAIDGPAMFPGSRVQPRGRVRAAGRLMRWYFVPPATNQGSAFAGHLVLLWNADGHTYAYGFHDLATLAVARALDLEVIRHLAIVQPHTRG